MNLWTMLYAAFEKAKKLREFYTNYRLGLNRTSPTIIWGDAAGRSADNKLAISGATRGGFLLSKC